MHNLEEFTPARDERIVDITTIPAAIVTDEHGVEQQGEALGLPNYGIATQVANPARASWRTFAQSLVSFLIVANAVAVVVAAFLANPDNGLVDLIDPAVYGYIAAAINTAVVIGAAGAKLIALLMADPTVNVWIEKHLSFLAPIAPPKR